MVVKTSYTALMNALNIVTAAYTDKAVGVELQTVVVQVIDGQCTLCTGTFDTYCTTILETKSVEGAATVNIPAKALITALSGYNSIKTTVVEQVVLNVDDGTNAVTLEIWEVAKDEEQTKPYISRYRLQTAIVQACHKDMLSILSKQTAYADTEYTEVETAQLLQYIKTATACTTADDVGDVQSNRVVFDEQYVYVVPKIYVLLMQNTLPPVLRSIILKRTMAVFLRTYLQGVETVKVRVEPAGIIGNIVQVTVKTENSTAVMKAYSTKCKFDVSSFISMPNNRIEVPRANFNELVHRLVMLKEDVSVTIDFETAECYFANAITKQHIRAKTITGTGSYTFMIGPEILHKLGLCGSNLISADSTVVTICLETNSVGSVTIGLMDDTGKWQTKIRDLPVIKGDFEWT